MRHEYKKNTVIKRTKIVKTIPGRCVSNADLIVKLNQLTIKSIDQ